jgi:hypothetical protein
MGYSMTDQGYEEALRTRVCVRCIDGDGRGGCRVGGPSGCPLQRYLPQVVHAIHTVRPCESIEPYVAALRDGVCVHCSDQSPDGACTTRRDLECALDRYFPMVVETVEQFDIHWQELR